MTASALGDRFHEEFRAHSALVAAVGEKKHVADAMAFCERLAGERRRIDPLALEAARFELSSFRLHFRLKREAGRPALCTALPCGRPSLWLKRFAYEVPALAGRRLGRRPEERATVTLFVRAGGLRGFWYW
jgi:hypothetical protein